MSQPTLDAAGSASLLFSFGGSITNYHTVAGANRLLLVGCETVTSSLSSITYGGTALTLVDSQASGNQTTYIYYQLAPAVGTANMVMSLSGFGSSGAHVVSWNNVEQSGALGTASKGVATGGSVTTAVDDVAQDCIGKSSAIGSPAPDAGQTQLASGSETSNTSALGGSYESGVAGSIVMGWTGAGGTSCWIGVAIHGVSAPANPSPEDVVHLRVSILERLSGTFSVVKMRRLGKFIDRIRPVNLER